MARVLRTLTWNSLRRNRATAIILTLFIALSTMLASSAAALLITVTGASESLMQQARTPHFLQMHAGSVDATRMTRFTAALGTGYEIEDAAISPMLNVDGAAIRVTGEGIDTTLAAGLQDNAFVAQNDGFDFLLDTSNTVIDPAVGSVWLPLYYRELLGLREGLALTVSAPSGPLRFEVAGFLRDSQMNSSYASSKRLLVNPADLAALETAMGEAGSVEHLIQFRLTDAGDVGAFEVAYRAAGLEANGPTITWSLFVLVNSLSEGITAAVLILVTLLLVGISLLCVRFALLTTVEQDYREIGVLKAIGVRPANLKQIYSQRYLLLACTGAVIGIAASWFLSRLLVRHIELFLGSSGGALLSLAIGLLLAVLIVGVVMFAVRRTLTRIERVSPVQAIRVGSADAAPGRRRPGRWLPMTGDRPGTNLRLGLRALAERPRLYVIPLVIYTLAAFILILPQNLYTTVAAPGFITHMGAGQSDMRVDAQASIDSARIAQFAAALSADPQISAHVTLSTASYTALDAAGMTTTLKIESGDMSVFPLAYLQGRAPAAETEISLSRLQADALGAELGDAVEASPVLAAPGTAPLRFIVSGIYQDVTNGGRTAKMTAPHTSADLMWTTIAADFMPEVDADAAIADYAAEYPDLEVSSVAAYVDTTVGGTIEALRSAAIASFAIGLAVALLITGLFMRMLITRDSFSIAVMRAIGFRDRHVQTQYIVRSTIVLAIGVVLGTALAGTLGGPMAGTLLSAVGLSQLDLLANPWLAYLATPLGLLLVVVIATLLSTRPDRRFAISTTIKE